MLRSEAVQIIKRGLGFRQTQDVAIVAALQQAQRELEHGKTLPNWLMVFNGTLVVPAGGSIVALPTDFLRLHEEFPLTYFDSNGVAVHVPRKRQTEARDAYGTSDSLYPMVFSLNSTSYIQLFPPPTAALTLYLAYYGKATVLTSDIENAWLLNAPEYLIGIAGTQVAGDLRDAGAKQKFSEMAKMGAQAFFGAVIDEELAQRPLIMGRNN